MTVDGSDDDSGANGQSTPPASASQIPAPAAAPNYVAPDVNAGTTVAGKSDSNTNKPSNPAPGNRLQNPLGNFSSYTYQLTLYMITPDAYQAFIASNRTNINAINSSASTAAGSASTGGVTNGAYIVAQSGGIGKGDLRAPGFTLDYYIDDLKITNNISGKETQTATNTTDISFQIYEPYGFSFISKLKYAATQLASVTKSKNFKDLSNPSKQFFILGIRFQGYDKDGNVITGQETFAQDTFNPSGNNGGIYQRFYDITITGVQFKINGKATTYDITAVSTAPGAAFGVKRGIIDKGAKLQGITVRDMLLGDDPDTGLLGLCTKLNNDAKSLGYTPGLEPTYTVTFLGDADTIIGDATVVNDATFDLARSPNSSAKNVKYSNPAVEESSVPKTNMKQLTFRNGTPTLQAIQSIISQSSFLSDALTQIYKANTDDPSTPSPDSNPAILRWYNVCPEVTCKGWDDVTQDFSYDINFIIQTYETPVVVSAYAKKTAKYYGPHKRYEYWYSGKNSEILSYEQSLNNAYFNVTVAGSDKNNPGAASGGAAGISTKLGGQTGAANQGSSSNGYDFEAQGNFITSLFDPGSYAEAKISILGDPDFLMADSVSSVQSVYNQFYGPDGYTINPNGGQVFIEIDFKEAIDYDNTTGTMSINESILFWKYPPEIAKVVHGVSYQVLTCASTFKSGKFTQELGLVLNTFAGASGSSQTSTDNDPNGRESANTSSTTTTTASNATSNTGLLPSAQPTLDQAIIQTSAETQAAASNLTSGVADTTQQTSPTGGTDPSPPPTFAQTQSSILSAIIPATPAPTFAQTQGSVLSALGLNGVPVNKDVQDEDATSSNSSNTTVPVEGREA